MNKLDEKSLTKLYYSIGEVAKFFNVNTSLLRFWEKEFPGFSVKKNKSGNRLFTPKDIRNFNRIYELVKESGYTLEGAKKVLNSKTVVLPKLKITDHMVSDNTLLISKLEDLKSKLEELKNKNSEFQLD
jgi:DNA-binding transcriptional MerR regulator